MNTQTTATPPVKSSTGWRFWLALAAALLLVQAALRVWISFDLLTATGIEGQFGALVHWRIFDAFAGWIGILLLATAAPTDTRFPRVERFLLPLGLLGLVGASLFGDVSGRAILEIVVSSVLALGTLAVCFRQLAALGRSARTVGLDLEQLWRGITLQWALLWITADIALRIKFWRDGIEAEPRARTILFLLPIVGLLPNVMMALGLRWWNIWRGAPDKRPRLRAWLVSLAATNVGAVLGVASLWFSPLAIAAAFFMALGIGMYFVGFPKDAWKSSRALPFLAAAFALLAIGLVMMAFDTSVERDLFSAAWRHLLSGILTLWLFGAGFLAMNSAVPQRLRAPGPALASVLLFALGLLAAAAILLAAIQDRSAMQGLFVATILQLLGIIVGSAAFARASRGAGAP
ncbi:MAG: hypothetical protein ACTHN5_07115 [Phycisphaerae bacterium]